MDLDKNWTFPLHHHSEVKLYSEESFKIPPSPWCVGHLDKPEAYDSSNQFHTDVNRLAGNKSVCVEMMYLEPGKLD